MPSMIPCSLQHSRYAMCTTRDERYICVAIPADTYDIHMTSAAMHAYVQEHAIRMTRTVLAWNLCECVGTCMSCAAGSW